MRYNIEKIKDPEHLSQVVNRWQRRIDNCMRENHSKGSWVGKGSSHFGAKLQAKLAEVIASASNAENNAEAMCMTVAELTCLAHMFCDNVLDETEPARDANREAKRKSDRDEDLTRIKKRREDYLKKTAAQEAKQANERKV